MIKEFFWDMFIHFLYPLMAYTFGFFIGFSSAEEKFEQEHDCKEIKHIPTMEGCIGCEPVKKYCDEDEE